MLYRGSYRGRASRHRRQQRRQQALVIPGQQHFHELLRLQQAAGLLSPQQVAFLMKQGQYPVYSGDMSLMVAGNGLVGMTQAVGGLPAHVAAGGRLEARRRDSGDSESRSTNSAGSSAEEHAPNKIFVGGISFQTTPEKLRAYFAPYGTILDVMVLKDPATNRNRGFGFVTFADLESVNKVLSQEEHMLDGKKIDPKLATPKGQKTAGELLIPRKVFVGGVSQETSSQELLEYFSQFGKVLECSLQMDNNTKRHRGFAFVTFENEEHSARVVKKHHHVVKSKTVECKYAQPKETIQATERAKRVQLLSVMQSAMVNNLTQAQQHYSRVMSTGGAAFSGLSGYRYSPYTVPVAAAAAAAAQQPQLGPQLAAMPAPMPPVSSAAFQGQGLPALQGLQALQPAAAPGAYQFANIDMSSLQGLDWGGAPLYGMYSA